MADTQKTSTVVRLKLYYHQYQLISVVASGNCFLIGHLCNCSLLYSNATKMHFITSGSGSSSVFHNLLFSLFNFLQEYFIKALF